jgi:hypothetical protein
MNFCAKPMVASNTPQVETGKDRGVSESRLSESVHLFHSGIGVQLPSPWRQNPEFSAWKMSVPVIPEFASNLLSRKT